MYPARNIMFGAKSTSILNFFKPVAKQTPSKRPLSQGSSPDEVRPRSKSPRTTLITTRAPRTQYSSQDNKQINSQQTATTNHDDTAGFPEATRSLSSSESDASNEIEVIDLPDTSNKPDNVIASTSTGQDITRSSTTELASSSHRTERNGEIVVTGSDDDSDELLDLDHLLQRKPLTPKPLPQRRREHDTRNKSDRRQKNVYEDTSAADQAKFNKVMEKAKNDLARSRDQQHALDQANKFATESSEVHAAEQPKGRHFTTETILSRVGDLDPEKAEKFVQAIERTELTQGIRYWSFFDASLVKSRREQVMWKWPEMYHQPEWSNYKESPDRDLAFISGVFEQAAADRQLPPEILAWILNQSFIEPRLDLRNAYHLVLRHAETCISSDQILEASQSVLHRFGATKEAMSTSFQPIQPQAPHKDHVGTLPITREPLYSWLQNMRVLMPMISHFDLGTILDILFLLTLDSAIPNEGLLLRELQTTTKECIEQLAGNPVGAQALQYASQRIFLRAGSIHFRLQFIRCLPIVSNTLSLLRRDFARAAFHEDSSWLSPRPGLTSLQDLGAVLKRDERFQLTKKTDYQDVAAYIACFDVAAGAGDQGDHADSMSIAQFDAVMDELIEIVRLKHARIHTVGAVHMLRTEVKDTLTTIEKRLLFSARIERKQRPHAFVQTTLEGYKPPR